jgi:hypothetical protein
MVANGIHQGPADAPTLLCAEDGDDLALTVNRSISE